MYARSSKRLLAHAAADSANGMRKDDLREMFNNRKLLTFVFLRTIVRAAQHPVPGCRYLTFFFVAHSEWMSRCLRTEAVAGRRTGKETRSEQGAAGATD